MVATLNNPMEVASKGDMFRIRYNPVLVDG